MGTSRWSNDFYRQRASQKQAKGIDAFAYDQTLQSVPRGHWKVHEKLDPYNAVRESRDSAEHPESLAIGVIFDVTGSMGGIPRALQKKLAELMNLLTNKGYVEHPQILFGAVGDAYTDTIPLQIGQFESGVEMDEDLERIVLEGGGGGQRRESYDLALYFMGHKTSIDCFEKRGKKGYLFLIGDEMPYGYTEQTFVEKLVGDRLSANIPVREVFDKVKERYEVFFIVATGGCHGQEPEIKEAWRKYLNERVLALDDPEAVCETIALTIGLNEERVDIDDGYRDLVASGMDPKTAKAAAKALEKFADTKAVARPLAGILALNLGVKTGRTKRL
jgi:hypothetical protein